MALSRDQQCGFVGSCVTSRASSGVSTVRGLTLTADVEEVVCDWLTVGHVVGSGAFRWTS